MEKRKMLDTMEQLNEILSQKDFFIFGAGKTANVIVKYASKKKCVVRRILVSDMSDNPTEILGIPVYTMSECQEDLKGKTVIVAVMENMHREVENELACYGFGEAYFISNVLLQAVHFHMGDYEIEYLERLKKIEGKIASQESKLLRFIPRPCLEYIVLNILDHCNLKCKGCDHFACVADPYFVEYETIHRDLDRLAELFHGDYITKIGVMGGEPLLHPDLLRILTDVRDHFPYAVIRLTTNGLLLLKQNDEFWRVCREQKVTIVNTKYPINLDFQKMKEKAEREGVEFRFFEGTGDHRLKKSFKKVINLKGDSNPVESFADCYISNYGNFLMEGKLYSCPFSCQSYRIFNKKFSQNLRMTEKDFLDIYKVQDMQEILDFAARPKYYCRYCSGLSPLFDWTRSKKEISEWIEEEDLL